MPYIWERCPFAACMDRQRVNTKEIPTGESACTVCPLPCNRTGKRRQNRNSGSKICTRTSLVYQHLPNPWKAAPWIVSKPVRYALCIRYSTRGRVFFVSQILSTPTRVSPGRKGTYGQHVPEALLCSLRVRSCVCISPGKSPTWLRMEYSVSPFYSENKNTICARQVCVHFPANRGRALAPTRFVLLLYWSCRRSPADRWLTLPFFASAVVAR